MGRRGRGEEEEQVDPEEAKYQGKTYDEWRQEVLLSSGINPLDFLVSGGDKGDVEAKINEAIGRNNGAVMALMYVDLIFQRGQSLHHLYRVNTVAYTERSKVSMQKDRNGKLVGMSAAGAPSTLDRFLRGELRLNAASAAPVATQRSIGI